MSYARTLHRQINADLVARIEASGLPKKVDTAAAKKRRPPREAWTYRSARRNEARASQWKQPMKLHRPELIENWVPAVELNRSPNWVRATSYSYAREISPCPERPVR